MLLRTFVHTGAFEKAVKNFKISEEELIEAQFGILDKPEGDAHLCQTFYKIRISKGSKGKRGGYRCWYFYYKDDVYLVYALPKNEGENISKQAQQKICEKIGKLLKGGKENDL